MNEREKITEFWNGLYGSGRMPWDLGGIPDRLSRFLDRASADSVFRRVLIPGCGSGYEAALFEKVGCQVTALDFSQEALARAREILTLENPGTEVSFVEGDFFEYRCERPFHLIYERAFLCSFSPGRRAEYARKCHELLSDRGVLCGFFYVDAEKESGPPYPIPEESLKELLRDRFELVEDEAVPASCKDSLDVFDGCERFQVWRISREDKSQ
ncbi:MAG: methyltransferase domain-containing protein [Candidatus Obscuribacterales bacterium]